MGCPWASPSPFSRPVVHHFASVRGRSQLLYCARSRRHGPWHTGEPGCACTQPASARALLSSPAYEIGSLLRMCYLTPRSFLHFEVARRPSQPTPGAGEPGPGLLRTSQGRETGTVVTLGRGREHRPSSTSLLWRHTVPRAGAPPVGASPSSAAVEHLVSLCPVVSFLPLMQGVN